MENKIKRILCLGNQTEDTNQQCVRWSKLFQIDNCKLFDNLSDLDNPGVYHPDLSTITIDNIWTACDQVDLLILLDQPLHSYDSIETFHHFSNLICYKKRFMPVLDQSSDDLKIWIKQLGYNSKILSKLTELKVKNTNVVVELYPATDIDEFKQQVNDIAAYLQNQNCKWVFYRASAHEQIHYEVTDYLLTTYPEFVLFNPAVFRGPIQSSIVRRIYQHWIHLNARNI